ncbi:MAG: hypothetical protein AAGL49_09640, partial [Pseudomonadota bacterium]
MGARVPFIAFWFALATWLLAAPAYAAEVQFEIDAGEAEQRTIEALLKPLAAVRDVGGEAPERDLRRAAAGDVRRFQRALTAEGYFAASADYAFGAQGEARAIQFLITPGPAYKITAYAIRYADDVAGPRPLSPAEAGVETTGSPRAADIQRVGDEILAWFRSQGFPHAKLADQVIEAQAGADVARAVYVFETGRAAVFGPTKLPDGLRVDPE